MGRSRVVPFALLLGVLAVSVPASAEVRWAVYYAERATAQDFRNQTVLVFDSDRHPALPPLRGAGKVLLGYLSLGEVASSRAYFPAVRAEGILLQENENWKGSFFVDVRDSRWAKRVLDELVPSILSRGFTGVFLDTLDNPGHLERLDAAKYRGMRAAAVELVKSIRRRYPTIKVMMNRGYDLLPEVEGDLTYVLGESVFATYDFQRKRYVLVPKPLYEEQVRLLNAARRRRPNLEVLTLDYWNPDDKDGIARIYAEQRKNGFSPYVATIELDRLVGEPSRIAAEAPIARVILALYDSRYDRDTRFVPIHQIAEMPLNHLGLVVRYHDINRPLPALEQMQDVRGVLTWFRSDSMVDPKGFLEWAGTSIDAGKRFVVVGDVGAAFDLKRQPTPESLVNQFWSRLGLTAPGQWRAMTYDWKIAYADPSIVGFERPIGGVLPEFPRVTKIDRGVTSYLVIRRGNDQSSDVQLLTIGPHGAYVAGGYVHYSQLEDSRRRQWYVNPFELFRVAFGTDEVPKADTSTMSGRRIFYSHIDGDGWRNVTEVPRYKKRRTLSAEVILREVLETHPDLPVTVAPVAGDLDPAWFGSDESLRAARAILALPHVEAGTHTYGHPLAWRYLTDEASAAASSAPRLFGASIGRVFARRPRDQVAGDGPAGVERPSLQQMRTYNVRPFSLDLEIRESIAYITSLLPPGKQVRVLQWSGDTSPSAAAIAATRAAGIRNLNGGDTRFDQEFPSYAWVAPLGRQVGDERQVYSSNSNENTYTDRWTDRFFSFRYLQATLRNTESPIRVKPHNIYYHMYSGEKLPSLAAVMENYEYARTQELAPITAAAYAAVVDGFHSIRFVSLGPDRWRIERRDGLQTIRFDRAAGRAVDFSRSQGVIGQRRYQGSLYLALDSSESRPIVALTNGAARGPYLSHSRWLVSNLGPCGDGFVFDTQGFGPGDSTWTVSPGTAFQVRITSPGGTTRETMTSDASGLLALVLPTYTNQTLHVSVMRADQP